MLLTEYRLDLVVQALRTILPLEHPADTSLRYFFQAERIGSNERALVAETVFGVLRHRLFLEHGCGEQITPRRMALAYWVKFGGYNLRELTPLLKATESEWLVQVKSLKVNELPLSVQAELPDWIIDKLRGQYSDEEILAIGQSMQQAAGPRSAREHPSGESRRSAGRPAGRRRHRRSHALLAHRHTLQRQTCAEQEPDV